MILEGKFIPLNISANQIIIDSKIYVLAHIQLLMHIIDIKTKVIKYLFIEMKIKI